MANLNKSMSIHIPTHVYLFHSVDLSNPLFCPTEQPNK